MIQKFLSGLSSKEKKILGVATVVVLVALFDRLLIGPTMSKMADIEEQISAEKSAIKRNQHFLAYSDQINEEKNALSQYYSDDAGSEKKIITQFLSQIESVAKRTNVTLSKVNAGGTEHGTHNLKYFVSLECSGTLEQVTDFIYNLETGSDLLSVTKINLSPKRSNPEEVQSVMTVAKTIVPSGAMPDAETLATDEAAGSNL